MKQSSDSRAPGLCESILRAELEDNLERGILASQNIIIRRLLNRSDELNRAFSEIEDRLNGDTRRVTAFFGTLLCSAAQWSPEKNAAAREDKKRLAAINAEIAEVADRLAELLEARSDLHNESGFASAEIYDLHSAVKSATKGHYLFQSYPETEFTRLFAQYDLKYWPNLSDVVRAVGEDAGSTKIYPTDPLTEAGTRSRRSSKADFFRSWFASLEENSVRCFGFLPAGFRVSDEAMASLADCALDIEPDQMTGAEYVKRLRQRARELCKSMGG